MARATGAPRPRDYRSTQQPRARGSTDFIRRRATPLACSRARVESRDDISARSDAPSTTTHRALSAGTSLVSTIISIRTRERRSASLPRNAGASSPPITILRPRGSIAYGVTRSLVSARRIRENRLSAGTPSVADLEHDCSAARSPDQCLPADSGGRPCAAAKGKHERATQYESPGRIRARHRPARPERVTTCDHHHGSQAECRSPRRRLAFVTLWRHARDSSAYSTIKQAHMSSPHRLPVLPPQVASLERRDAPYDAPVDFLLRSAR